MLLSLFRPQCPGAVRHQVRLEMMLGAVPTLGSAVSKLRPVDVEECVHTHRLHSSSFLGLPYRILNMNPKKEYYGASGYSRLESVGQ